MRFIILPIIGLCAGASASRFGETSDELQLQEVVDEARDASSGTALLANSKKDAVEYAVAMATLNCLMMRATKVASEPQTATRLVVDLFMLEQAHKGGVLNTFLQDLRYFLKHSFSEFFAEETLNDDNFNDYRYQLMLLGRDGTQMGDAMKVIQKDKSYFQDLYGKGVKLPGPDTVGFDYNHERDLCTPKEGGELHTKIKTYVSKVADEFAGGECDGGCSRFSLMTSACGPKQGGRMCPEGTACSCKRSTNAWAPAVFVGSYIGIFIGQGVVLTLAGKPYLMAVMPVDPWAITVTGYFSSTVHGCMCMAKTCTILKTEADEEVCGIEAGQGDWEVEGVGLPFVGRKCTKASGKCEFQLCEAEDMHAGFGRLGVHDGNTYNCWRQFWEHWTYMTREERFQVYQNQLHE